jgi:hypothetical protein
MRMPRTIKAQISQRQLSSVAELQNPKLIDALAYWKSKCGDNGMPSRSEIDPIEMRPFLNRIILVDVEKDPQRYIFRLIGTLITSTTGRDVTGQYLDEVYTESQYNLLTVSLDHVVETRKPCRTTGSASFVDKDFVAVEALDLPLSTDGTDVNVILRVISFNV